MRGRALLDFAGPAQMLMTPLAPRRQPGRSNIEPPTAALKTNKERKIYALKKTCQHDNRTESDSLLCSAQRWSSSSCRLSACR